MCCPKCGSDQIKKFGKNRNGSQRYRCLSCKKTFTENQHKILGAMRLSYFLGKRDAYDTATFAENLRRSTSGRFQLSTDGWKPYEFSMPAELAGRIDFSMIVKIFKNPPRDGKYSPPQIVEVKKKHVCGNPNPERISTSHVERSNLTLRMTCRRWTRLTNAFSKSWKHHEAAIALYIAFYNFVRPHMTLKTTPAVAARLTDHRWTMEELLAASAA